MCRDLPGPRPTPFPGDPTGSSPGIQDLIEQEKRIPNHNSSFGVSVICPENFSPGCKHTVRFLESRRFLREGTIRNLPLCGGESGFSIVFSPQGALTEKMEPLYLESHCQAYPLLTKGSHSHKTF